MNSSTHWRGWVPDIHVFLTWFKDIWLRKTSTTVWVSNYKRTKFAVMLPSRSIDVWPENKWTSYRPLRNYSAQFDRLEWIHPVVRLFLFAVKLYKRLYLTIWPLRRRTNHRTETVRIVRCNRPRTSLRRFCNGKIIVRIFNNKIRIAVSFEIWDDLLILRMRMWWARNLINN